MSKSKQRCGAKTKSGGECKAYAMSNGRCRLHGGLTPKGKASPHYKDGKRSKYRNLGKHKDAVEYHANNPDLASMLDEIAVFTARAEELYEQYAVIDKGLDYNQLNELWDQFNTAMKLGVKDQSQALRKQIDEEIKRGASSATAWAEYQRSVFALKSIIESERKFAKEKLELMRVGHALTIIDSFVKAVIESMSNSGIDTDVETKILGQLQIAYNNVIDGD